MSFFSGSFFQYIPLCIDRSSSVSQRSRWCTCHAHCTPEGGVAARGHDEDLPPTRASLKFNSYHPSLTIIIRYIILASSACRPHTTLRPQGIHSCMHALPGDEANHTMFPHFIQNLRTTHLFHSSAAILQNSIYPLPLVSSSQGLQ